MTFSILEETDVKQLLKIQKVSTFHDELRLSALIHPGMIKIVTTTKAIVRVKLLQKSVKRNNSESEPNAA